MLSRPCKFCIEITLLHGPSPIRSLLVEECDVGECDACCCVAAGSQHAQRKESDVNKIIKRVFAWLAFWILYHHYRCVFGSVLRPCDNHFTCLPLETKTLHMRRGQSIAAHNYWIAFPVYSPNSRNSKQLTHDMKRFLRKSRTVSVSLSPWLCVSAWLRVSVHVSCLSASACPLILFEVMMNNSLNRRGL